MSAPVQITVADTQDFPNTYQPIMPAHSKLFGPWRRSIQLTIAAFFVLTPFIKIQGQSAIRLDIPTLTLYLVGIGFRIEELYIVCIFIFFLIFIFLLITLTMGRVWCGWICPQTIFSDFADFLKRKLSAKSLPWSMPIKTHLIYFTVSAITGSTVVSYFTLQHFWVSIWQGNMTIWPCGTALTITIVIYLNLAFVRRLFCRDFCPYGRFQTVLVDEGTLTLQAHPKHLARCINCKSCVKVCPTGIDVRNGYQIECINCARCLDACRTVMAKKNQPGIIQYTFGLQDKGIKALLNFKTAALLIIVLSLCGAFVYTASHRTTATLTIGRSQIKSRVANGKQITFFQGSIANLKNKQVTLNLTVTDTAGIILNIKGPSSFALTKRQKTNINFAVISPIKKDNKPIPILFLLTDNKKKNLQQVKGFY